MDKLVDQQAEWRLEPEVEQQITMAYGSRNKWSNRAYSLQTAIDVLGLPCLVRVSDQGLIGGSIDRLYEAAEKEALEDEGLEVDPPSLAQLLPRRAELTIESEMTLFNVHARVLYFSDPDKVAITKGADFVAKHSRFVGTEIFIPLGYSGLVRTVNNDPGKEYFNITEVIEDFPKFIRVEKDTAGASPGQSQLQVVKAGAVLELDRFTKGPKEGQGKRKSYLVCRDNLTRKELAFAHVFPVHFSRLADPTKYTLNQLVEQLALPKIVEFRYVNPNTILTWDDNEARDIMVMLSGPIEILGVQKQTAFVGMVRDPVSLQTNSVFIPQKCTDLQNVQVHISNDIHPVSEAVSDSNECVDCELLRSSLYIQYQKKLCGLVLKNKLPPGSNDESWAEPDTPSPTRPLDYKLKPALSVPVLPSGESSDMPRKRCRSSGDVLGLTLSGDGESRKLKSRKESYLSRIFSTLIRRKGNKSSSKKSETEQSTLRKRSSHRQKNSYTSLPESSGFRCYIDETYVLGENQPVDPCPSGTMESTILPVPNTGGPEGDKIDATIKLDRIRCYEDDAYYCELCRHNAIEDKFLVIDTRSDSDVFASDSDISVGTQQLMEEDTAVSEA